MSGNSFLIKFSGKDHLILRYSTEVEKTAYSCLGLLVISMSLIAFLSMLFALDLIYFPEGYTPHQLLTSFDFYLSLTISFIWALIVYNFFRLTVSAHSIDAERFRLANLPRIFLKSLFGIVLGVSVQQGD